MQINKRNTFRVFIMVLFTGIVGIVGSVILKFNIDKLSANYETIINQEMVKNDYVCDIETLIYRHQVCVCNHVNTDDSEKMEEFERQAEEIEKELNLKFEEFAEYIEGGEAERIYHNAFSSYTGYLYYAHVAMELSVSNQQATVSAYSTSTMAEYVAKADEYLKQLRELTVSEMNEAKEIMNECISVSRNSEIICISCIAVFVVVCLFYCSGITNGLERYRDELIAEVEKKNEALLEHSRKIIAIQDSTIVGMANLIENRDGDTGAHVKRTAMYVKLLANKAMEDGRYKDVLNEHYIELLVKAAPLHDVGKISVSDMILNKPGKLTAEEFETMKIHTTEGGKIVEEVLGEVEEQEYVDIAKEVAMYHHEKWNGAGYPSGLKEDDIPVCARIMAIADVFDALISKRCYKEAFPIDEAYNIIRESAGSHFDPELVKLFMEIRPQVEEFLRSEL